MKKILLALVASLALSAPAFAQNVSDASSEPTLPLVIATSTDGIAVTETPAPAAGLIAAGSIAAIGGAAAGIVPASIGAVGVVGAVGGLGAAGAIGTAVVLTKVGTAAALAVISSVGAIALVPAAAVVAIIVYNKRTDPSTDQLADASSTADAPSTL